MPRERMTLLPGGALAHQKLPGWPTFIDGLVIDGKILPFQRVYRLSNYEVVVKAREPNPENRDLVYCLYDQFQVL
jgi:hypothetical protein